MDQTANQDKKSSRSSVNRNPFKTIKNKVNDKISSHKENQDSNEQPSEPLNIQSPMLKEETEESPNAIEQPVTMFEEDQFNKDGDSPEIHQSPSYVEKNEEKPKTSSSKPAEIKSEGDVLNNGFDKSQEEVSKNHIEISDKLELERRKELENAGRKLKLKMFKQQRCYL